MGEWVATSRRDELSKRTSEYARTKRRADPDWGANVQRQSKFLKKYGLSLPEYDRMFLAQSGCCAICERPAETPLHVDHQHSTNKIRGLLCKNCNLQLGWFDLYAPTIVEYARG